MTQKEKKFEEAFHELEALVEKLESGDLSLDESLDFYEKGMALAKWCADKLNAAELRLEQLANDTQKEI